MYIYCKNFFVVITLIPSAAGRQELHSYISCGEWFGVVWVGSWLGEWSAMGVVWVGRSWEWSGGVAWVEEDG